MSSACRDVSSITPRGPAPSSGRRINARLRLGIPARLILISGNCECLLNDISASGARISLAELPRCGSSALLRFLEFEVFCEVKWARRNQCGLLFAERLSGDNLVELRGIADSYGDYDRAAQARRTHDWVMGRTRVL